MKDLILLAESGVESERFRTTAYELEISEFTDGSELDTDNDDYDELGEASAGNPKCCRIILYYLLDSIHIYSSLALLIGALESRPGLVAKHYQDPEIS